MRNFWQLHDPLMNALLAGGRFLQCDCRVAWITEWIRDYDLQVTSRERQPQFCGQPPELRERSFYQVNPSDLACNASITEDPLLPPSEATTVSVRTTSTTTSTTATTPLTTTAPPPTTTTTQQPAPAEPDATSYRPGTAIRPEIASRSEEGPTGVGSVGSIQRGPGGESPSGGGSAGRPTTSTSSSPSFDLPPTRSQQRPPRIERPPSQPVPSASRPNLVLRTNDDESADDFFGARAQVPYVEEVIVQHAYRKDNSVIIQWDSEVSNILGFRVVYRLFGDKNFKLGPPLAASEREFKIKNVPTQECIVVCVVSLEDVNVTPSKCIHENYKNKVGEKCSERISMAPHSEKTHRHEASRTCYLPGCIVATLEMPGTFHIKSKNKILIAVEIPCGSQASNV
ncbi:uncharacterized protein LOC122257893 [Penaeus japonicus]|uniref:uncharacterized protein LOC122257893 n=1 Tax=Penaeus japonicus TaxID=27405 RepID=UPI001C70B1FA|nr:uncharacterized protein LOC122257893 [Penaeus japonicus]